MSAVITSPRTGDNIGIIAGGNVAVNVLYGYLAASNLQCFVDADPGPIYNLSGTGQQLSMVPCTLAAGNHMNVPVHAKTNGGISDTQTVTITVRPKPPGSPQATATTIPEPVTRLTAGAGPIQYLLRDDFAPDVAYLICAAHELTLTGDPPQTVDGVFIRRGDCPSWAALLTVPNNPNVAYFARIIEYDANDNQLSKQTVVLN